VDGNWQAKGACDLTLSDLAAHSNGLILIAIPNEDVAVFKRGLRRLCKALPQLRYLAASYLYRGNDHARINLLDALAGQHGLRLLASNEVLYHAPDRRPLQDIMTCIREHCTLVDAGSRLQPNAERHLKSPTEMQRLFSQWPHAISATREVADAIEVLNAERIGHGIHIINDIPVMDLCKENNITLEICLTSNWLTSAVSTTASHPI
jgi:error-prone DNA polymerase